MPDAQHESMSFDFLPKIWLQRIGIALFCASVAVSIYYFIDIYLRIAVYLRIAATIVLLAGVLTYLLRPIVEWLVRVSRAKSQHAARVWATLLAYLFLGVALYGIGASITRTVRHNVHEIYSTWNGAGRRLPQQYVTLRQWYLTRLPEHVRTQVNTSIQSGMANLSSHSSSSAFEWVPIVVKYVGGWIALFIELIFVPLIAFYFLTEGAHIANQAFFFVPTRHRETLLCYCRELDRILRQYIKGQMILCVIAWVVVTVALLLLRVPGAFLLGIIAGISRAIPVVGPVIGAVPVLAMVLLHFHGPAGCIWVLIGYIILHLSESKYLMPRILGDRLGIHPVFIIISLLVGYAMLGFLGMFLAPPAIAMIRYLVAHHRGDCEPEAEAS